MAQYANQTHKYIIKMFRHLIPVFSGIATIVTAQTGYAGFEWTPPAQNQSLSGQGERAKPNTPATGMQKVKPELVMPKKRQNRDRQPSESREGYRPTDITGKNGGKDSSQKAITGDQLPPVTSRQQRSTQANDYVEGFGKKIPLTLALQQIVPDDVRHSFGDKVNQNIPISWEGGDDWRTTLRNALQAKGLGMKIHDRVVHITKTPLSRSLASRASVPVSANVAEPANTTSPTTARHGKGKRPNEKRQQNSSTLETTVKPKSLSKHYNFKADAGDSLRATLKSWSHKADVELRWEPAYDFTLREDIDRNSNFAEAVADALDQYNKTAPEPYGRLHTTSNNGNPVLIIE